MDLIRFATMFSLCECLIPTTCRLSISYNVVGASLRYDFTLYEQAIAFVNGNCMEIVYTLASMFSVLSAFTQLTLFTVHVYLLPLDRIFLVVQRCKNATLNFQNSRSIKGMKGCDCNEVDAGCIYSFNGCVFKGVGICAKVLE